jgi:hypothetical protein
MATASLAASAMMSAHDTVRGQVSSSVDLAAAMTSNPLTDKFGSWSCSELLPVSRIDASQPWNNNSRIQYNTATSQEYMKFSPMYAFSPVNLISTSRNYVAKLGMIWKDLALLPRGLSSRSRLWKLIIVARQITVSWLMNEFRNASAWVQVCRKHVKREQNI